MSEFRTSLVFEYLLYVVFQLIPFKIPPKIYLFISEPKATASAVATSAESSDKNADPKKKLRNLKKKLSDIESLQSRLDSGELKHPEPEQLDKLNRREQVESEICELEELIKKL